MRYLFLAALLISVQGFAADYTGNWSGKGEIEMFVSKDSQGKAPCSVFDYDIESTPTQLIMRRGYFHCGAEIEVKLDTRIFNIVGENVFKDDEQGTPIRVGTLTADGKLSLLFQVERETNAFDVQLTSENTAHYSHLWTDGYTSLLINGELKKNAK